MAAMMAHQYPVRNSDIPMTTRVGSGSSMLTEANMLWNTGMTKMSSTVMAMPATLMMTAGYIMALFTLRIRASFFSRKVARRSRMVSRMPPASPAATMFTNSPREGLGVPAEGVGQGVAGLDVEDHLLGDVLQRLVLGLRRQDRRATAPAAGPS